MSSYQVVRTEACGCKMCVGYACNCPEANETSWVDRCPTHEKEHNDRLRAEHDEQRLGYLKNQVIRAKEDLAKARKELVAERAKRRK